MARLSGNLVAIRASIWKRYGRGISVGWLGDRAHRSRKSDHNPDGRGIVCAIDPMLRVGPRAASIVKAAKGRSDLAYIIYNRTIWSASYGWRARRYTGSDPHTGHVHISSKHTTAANNRRVGLSFSGAPVSSSQPASATPSASKAPKFPGVLKRGSKGSAVRTLQSKLKSRGWNISVDSDYGAHTTAIVKAFQRQKKLTADGIVGPKTWSAVWTSKVTSA